MKKRPNERADLLRFVVAGRDLLGAAAGAGAGGGVAVDAQQDARMPEGDAGRGQDAIRHQGGADFVQQQVVADGQRRRAHLTPLVRRQHHLSDAAKILLLIHHRTDGFVFFGCLLSRFTSRFLFFYPRLSPEFVFFSLSSKLSHLKCSSFSLPRVQRN